MNGGYVASYNKSDYLYSLVSSSGPNPTDPPTKCPSEKVDSDLEKAICANYSDATALYALQRDATSREYLQDAENNYWIKLVILFNYVLGIFVLVYAIARLSSAVSAPSTTLTLTTTAAQPPQGRPT